MEENTYGYTAQFNRIGSSTYTYRPLIDVEIGSETKSRKFKALIDSGTEVTVMDLSIAMLLGISSEGRSAGYISGIEEMPRKGFIAPVTLRVDGFEEKVFTFDVLFIESLQNNFDVILGQQDFFLNFDITFHKSKNNFHLKRAF